MQTSIEKINSFLDELKSDINAAKKLAYRFEDIQNRVISPIMNLTYFLI